MVVSLWITVGLVIAATAVASLGAYFSVHGLGLLFSGAIFAVWAMGVALEFAKFMLAAYLHQTWATQNKVFRYYLSFAIVVLSIVTSVGIYGFLSDAYQSASTVLEAETVKIANIKSEQSLISAEINRLNKMVEEIPANRISRRLKARAEVEPVILELNAKYEGAERNLAASNLKLVEVKKQVGPLIHIAKNFNMNVDLVVSYLILILVTVFDPLAICLVIASTHALASRVKRVKVPIAVDNANEMVKPTALVKENELDQNVIVQMNFKDEGDASNGSDQKAV
jgi:hypothetical protein